MKPTRKKPAKTPIKILRVTTSGASELVKIRGGYELRIYTGVDDAISLGVDPKLAERIFAKPAGACSGNCTRQEDRTFKKTWCRDVNCAGTGSCACHLVSMWRNKDGDIEEEDHGTDFDSKSPHNKIPGRVYVCRCQ